MNTLGIDTLAIIFVAPKDNPSDIRVSAIYKIAKDNKLMVQAWIISDDMKTCTESVYTLSDFISKYKDMTISYRNFIQVRYTHYRDESGKTLPFPSPMHGHGKLTINEIEAYCNSLNLKKKPVPDLNEKDFDITWLFEDYKKNLDKKVSKNHSLCFLYLLQEYIKSYIIYPPGKDKDDTYDYNYVKKWEMYSDFSFDDMKTLDEGKVKEYLESQSLKSSFVNKLKRKLPDSGLTLDDSNKLHRKKKLKVDTNVHNKK
jgi:hypothetical protein